MTGSDPKNRTYEERKKLVVNFTQLTEKIYPILLNLLNFGCAELSLAGSLINSAKRAKENPALNDVGTNTISTELSVYQYCRAFQYVLPVVPCRGMSACLYRAMYCRNWGAVE